ncbi:MAG TPA: hypothetical protein VGO21_02435 [Candidatus Paceibacterota bacterium]|jgi:hypothetical protein|nr:hypothetical protein [Candidatus Paceibacterota bacterium]
MFNENIGYITVAISFACYFFYFRDVFYGKTRPNLVSWFLWMLGPFIGVFFQLKAGAGLSVLPVFMAGFGPLVVISVSLFRKNSIWKINKLDIICGILACVALVLYVFTHNLGISIIFAILSDGLAAIPTIVKSWKFPETETATVYLSGIFNNILGLLIIKNWIFSIYSFGVYFIVVNIIIVFCIYRKKILKVN